MRTYLHRVLVAIDDFCQAVSNRGVIGITISARAYTARKHGHKWGIILGNILDKISPNHCYKALLADRARAQMVLDNLKEY